MHVPWAPLLLAVSSIVATSLASPVDVITAASRQKVIPPTDYEVIIIGGGPAGLSALSALARVRRKAVVFDSGEYRNKDTRHQHDVYGWDGAIPSVVRSIARRQILSYPSASIVETKIMDIEYIEEGPIFTATDYKGKRYTARKIVLASGMRDILPPTPGIRAAWGKGIYWCTWCDGYENRDRSLGLLGNFSTEVIKTSIYVQSLNKDVIIYADGTWSYNAAAKVTEEFPDWQAQLASYNVSIDNRPIASIDRVQGSVTEEGEDEFEVKFKSGGSTVRQAFLAGFPAEQASDLAQRLGLEISDQKIVVNKDMETSMPGVYAIGDANSDGSSNVAHAMSSARRAGVTIVHALAAEDAQALSGTQNAPGHK
ncbi:putative thioredoxin reductase [Xylona heveae TC161]|uniref:Putative thioredoxin reductase n=1 Tax=Xylona heveae (strain CBS 132557 / TC161) TaxID=1328760 RepID=A0A165A2X0_XYLHT|nr:putative thioredoxin reductase [Xylona heveae TC161]KZF19879.1 putative thioredoxin reductase [Xylona heveae TC161]